MEVTYLNVDFKEKDAVKALGARWDAAQRKWYVPEGRELTPFTKWLPVNNSGTIPKFAKQFALESLSGVELCAPSKKGMSLSNLLSGVAQAVQQAYKSGVWVLIEVVELRANGGHVFLGVSERGASGAVLAKTSAVIWQSTANTILPEFERATGVQLAPGIKLLVRARPVFKPLHGFSLEIDGIDPEYTLGDLEARKREIRERLTAEGVFAANKRLPAPWDFNLVLVVAPAGGAGLGDFQAEANRLAQCGVCQFVYVFSRFQGEGAAREICDALQVALSHQNEDERQQPDAVVIIRGGGAVNDLAWLNDYDLARYICDLQVPVLTGIGHERDSTVLDEVAHTKYDTPSKVIGGIEQTIGRRAVEARAFFELVASRSTRAAQSAMTQTTALDSAVRVEATRHIAKGKQVSAELIHAIKLDALREVRSASESSQGTFQHIRNQAQLQVSKAQRLVPALWSEVSMDAARSLGQASTASANLVDGVLDKVQRDCTAMQSRAEEGIASVGAFANKIVREAAIGSESLMREIAGQGPEKTLSRGFALIRDQEGQPLTRAEQVIAGTDMEIQFSDGKVIANAQR